MLPLIQFENELYSEDLFLAVILVILRRNKIEQQEAYLLLLSKFEQSIVPELLF